MAAPTILSSGRKFSLDKRRFFVYNHPCFMALWCSRLARQPVTLEVDGSSPFGVAINKNTTQRVVFLFMMVVPTDSKDSMRQSGGLSLAARLDGGNTTNFSKGKNVNEDLRGRQKSSHCEARRAVAIPYGDATNGGIPTPVCALARND